MNKNDIINGIMARVDDSFVDEAIVWPNIKPASEPTRPYIEAIGGSALRDDDTLKGGEITREEASFLFNVVVEQGTGQATANNLADQIRALFPSGQRIAITGGTITINRPTEIRAGFQREKADWVVPVVVRYVAIAD